MKRVNKEIGGNSKWMLIERRQCTTASCRKTYRLLPDISIPYKHYGSGVIDGTIDEEALSEEMYPCETTIQRWKEWAEQFLKNAEGEYSGVAEPPNPMCFLQVQIPKRGVRTKTWT